MSRLTQVQTKYLFDTQQGLEDREMVLLVGDQNGKTRIKYAVEESVAERDKKSGLIRTYRRHPESSELVFVPILWPRGDKINEGSFIYQFLKRIDPQIERKVLNDPAERYDAFIDTLKDARHNGRVFCLTVDNAHNLPRRAFDVIRAMNELRDTKRGRDIGLAAVIAGDYAGLWGRAGLQFFQHCREVTVGRIPAQEILQVIQYHYPVEASDFLPDALQEISAHMTTGAIHSAIRKVVIAARKERQKKIDRAFVKNNAPVRSQAQRPPYAKAA